MEDRLTLESYIKLVNEFEDMTRECRRLAFRDRDYVDHKQLSEEELSTLRKRGQPPVQNNRLRPKLDFLLGMERQLRRNPKALPRTPQHEQGAHGVSDALRYVTENNNWDSVRSDAVENMLVEGVGAIEAIIENTRHGQEIRFNHIPYDRLIWDPYSRRKDFSDANYKGLVIWLDRDDAIAYGAEEIIDQSIGDSTYDETFGERNQQWADKKRNRIKIVQIYKKVKGVWYYCMFTSGGFLQPPIPSPYVDEFKEPQCPIEMQSIYVDRDGNRYGVMRILIDLQDEVNKRGSKALHYLNALQTWAKAHAPDNPDQFKKEIAKPNGHITVNGDAEFGRDFGIFPTHDKLSGHVEFMRIALEAIDQIGVNSSLAGKEDRNLSGRALLARSQAGNTELGHAFDASAMMQHRIYKQAWNRIRQSWKDEKWIRVTDDERNLKFVALNKPVTVRDQMMEEFGGIPPEFENDPRLAMPIGMENAVDEVDIDLIIEDAPDIATIQSEQFELLNAYNQTVPGSIPLRMFIEMMPNLRNKDRILELVEGTEEQKQQQAQQAEEAQAIQKEAVVSEIDKKKASAEKDYAKANLDNVEAFIKQMEVSAAVAGFSGETVAGVDRAL